VERYAQLVPNVSDANKSRVCWKFRARRASVRAMPRYRSVSEPSILQLRFVVRCVFCRTAARCTLSRPVEGIGRANRSCAVTGPATGSHQHHRSRTLEDDSPFLSGEMRCDRRIDGKPDCVGTDPIGVVEFARRGAIEPVVMSDDPAARTPPSRTMSEGERRPHSLEGTWRRPCPESSCRSPGSF
jgi:hypothetical protein